MDTAIVTTEAELAALFAPWKALQARAACRGLFTDPDWFESWWRCLGKPDGWHLHIATGYRDGRLVAVAPLAVKRRRGLRYLQWAGAEKFDYCDMLLEESRHAEPLWQAVRRSRLYDLARIQDVRPDAACFPALASFARPLRQSRACNLRLAWPTGDAWMAGLSSSVRSHYRRRVRQLEAAGPVRHDVVCGGSPPEDVLDALIRQKRAWHAKRGEHDGLEADDEAFYHRVAGVAAGSGTLHLSALRCGDHIVAAHLGFVHDGALYWFLPSYDEAWSQFSPGRVLMFRCISWAIDNGLREFDFLRGEDPYKDEIANDVRNLTDLTFARTLAGYLGDLYLHRKKAGTAKLLWRQRIELPGCTGELPDRT